MGPTGAYLQDLAGWTQSSWGGRFPAPHSSHVWYAHVALNECMAFTVPQKNIEHDFWRLCVSWCPTNKFDSTFQVDNTTVSWALGYAVDATGNVRSAAPDVHISRSALILSFVFLGSAALFTVISLVLVIRNKKAAGASSGRHGSVIWGAAASSSALFNHTHSSNTGVTGGLHTRNTELVIQTSKWSYSTNSFCKHTHSQPCTACPVDCVCNLCLLLWFILLLW